MEHNLGVLTGLTLYFFGRLSTALKVAKKDAASVLNALPTYHSIISSNLSPIQVFKHKLF